MDVNLFKEKTKKGEVSIRPYKNGFRAAFNLEYKDGTSERIQTFSVVSPEAAAEKLYKRAREKYNQNLNKVDDEIVFSNFTNRELSKLEKDIPDKVVAESKYDLLIKNISQEWLKHKLEKTDKTKTKRKNSKKTFEYYRDMYRTYIAKDYGEIKITDLTLDYVQKVFDSKVKLKHKTLKGVKSMLNQIFEFSIKKGYIKENFMKDVELPAPEATEIDYYTEKQIEMFKGACDADRRAIVMLYRFNLVLGLRPEEGCGLKLNKIKFSENDNELAMVRIDNAVKVEKDYDENLDVVGSNKVDDEVKTITAYRYIPLPKDDEKVLIEYIKEQKKKWGDKYKDDCYVFLNRNGDPYTPEILTNKMPGFLEKWKLPHITPYGLRHSFASLMVKLGVKESVLKVIMGHTSILTTHKYYIHIPKEDIMQEIMEKTALRKEQLQNAKEEKQKVQEATQMLGKLDEIMKLLRINNEMSFQMTA